MKKVYIVLITVVCVIFFVALVRHAFKHRRGVPVVSEARERSFVEVPFVDEAIDLEEGIDLSLWQTRPSHRIELVHQITAIPWPKKVVPYVDVKAFHNGRDAYFYMEWEDSTEDANVAVSTFSDACAAMFPLGETVQPASLMMGFLGRTNIWQWKASHDRQYWLKEKAERRTYADFYYPFEEEELFVVSKDEVRSSAMDLVAVRVGTVTPKPAQNVISRGIHDEGRWTVVFSRSLKVMDEEIDARFDAGERLCAFAVWNGSEGDRGGRKSISDWVEMRIR